MSNNSDSYRPTIAQVASIIRARTKDKYGSELGTFNADTRPTGDQVTDLIDLALGMASAAIGQSVPSILWEPVSGLVAVNAASLIQASYWPEQVQNNTTLFDFWNNWYNEGIKAMALAVRAENEGDDEGADGTANLPVWGDGDALPRAESAEWAFSPIWDSYVRTPSALNFTYDQLPLWARRAMGI